MGRKPPNATSRSFDEARPTAMSFSTLMPARPAARRRLPDDPHRAFLFHVRRYGHAAACRPFGRGPRPRLLRRRQCARAAFGLRARRPAASGVARSPDGALYRFHPARVESRHAAVPQFHGLWPQLARSRRAPKTATGARYGRSAYARADGTSPSRRRWAEGPLRTGAADGRGVRLAARLGIRLARARCRSVPAARRRPPIGRMRDLLAAGLWRVSPNVTTPDWVWFEDGLAYDNARLPQALILTGRATGDHPWSRRASGRCGWLMGLQTAGSGLSARSARRDSAGRGNSPRAFDQQPVDAAATISACLAACDATQDRDWADDARRAFRGFSAPTTSAYRWSTRKPGACSDGLHRDRRNENNGAESVAVLSARPRRTAPDLQEPPRRRKTRNRSRCLARSA